MADVSDEEMTPVEMIKPVIVFPGEVITLPKADTINLGNGLMQSEFNDVRATKAGILHVNELKNETELKVINSQKRYIPRVQDSVIGVIIEKSGEYYKIDIGAPFMAVLPVLAFEGATKRNRPFLEVGAVVYCRVVVYQKDIAPEVSCISLENKKDWMTGESLYMELVNGYLFSCPISLCHNLLDTESFILKCLQKILSFEVAIGVNGRVWVNSKLPLHVILISNAILNSHGMNNDKIEAMIQQLSAIAK